MAAPKTLRAFCIGHVMPVFAPTLPYTMLTPRPLGLRGEIVLADQRFGPGIHGAALAEYSQLFGLQDLLEAGDLVADRLYLFQYRKFIGLREGGLPATAPWLRIAPPAQARALMPTEAELHAVTMPVVVGSMLALGNSVAQNYARVHVIDDLVTFAACLGAAGFDAAAVRRFASFQGLLPSPALCLVDTPLFLAHLRTLRAAWTAFTRGSTAVRREGYQMRVAGYLLERLHSHLLCQGLADGTQPHVGLGHRYVVMDPAAPAAQSKAPSPAAEEPALP
ncbi:MAG: hypothetical protein JNL30_00620 [Rubrivivax sp.]|nr:hypothetical protein [Rubrivivax sp.]